MAPRETENNAYAKFWADKQRALWYVMVFSGLVNNPPFLTAMYNEQMMVTQLVLLSCYFGSQTTVYIFL